MDDQKEEGRCARHQYGQGQDPVCLWQLVAAALRGLQERNSQGSVLSADNQEEGEEKMKRLEIDLDAGSRCAFVAR